jgi:hypothetical protein
MATKPYFCALRDAAAAIRFVIVNNHDQSTSGQISRGAS